MCDLLNRETQDVRVAEVIALFFYRAKKQIGVDVAALVGLDTLVFTGGIDERLANTSLVRSRKGSTFSASNWMNRATRFTQIEFPPTPTRVSVRIIRTDEELMIARSVCQIPGINSLTKEVKS